MPTPTQQVSLVEGLGPVVGVGMLLEQYTTTPISVVIKCQLPTGQARLMEGLGPIICVGMLMFYLN